VNERREFVRLSANVNIKWSKAGAAQESAFQSQDMSLDIGGGGVCLIVYEKLPIGKELDLEIELPTGKTISSKAKVAWIQEFEIIGAKQRKGYEIGAQFLDISDEDKAAIDKFMIHRPQK